MSRVAAQLHLSSLEPELRAIIYGLIFLHVAALVRASDVVRVSTPPGSFKSVCQ
jgi:hypothetical protein